MVIIFVAFIFVADRQTKIQISGGMNPGVLDPPEHNLMGGRQKRWLEHGILDVHSHLHRT